MAAIIIIAGITNDKAVDANVMNGVNDATHSVNSVMLIGTVLLICTKFWDRGISEMEAKNIENAHITIITMIVKLTLHHSGGIGWVHKNHRSSEITINERDDAVQQS